MSHASDFVSAYFRQISLPQTEEPKNLVKSSFVLGGVALLILSTVPHFAEAALICKDGHLLYGGGGFYANRLKAENSAIQAWRRVEAASNAHAEKMFPEKEQLRCARPATGHGWRCFVRGGPCRAT
jgi:hypothetical protein